MTPAEVERALERLRAVKAAPRDLLPNRARIERAHRLFAELTGLARRQVADAIDAFESALEGGNDEEVAFARACLDALLGDYYADEDEHRESPDGDTAHAGERDPDDPAR